MPYNKILPDMSNFNILLCKFFIAFIAVINIIFCTIIINPKDKDNMKLTKLDIDAIIAYYGISEKEAKQTLYNLLITDPGRVRLIRKWYLEQSTKSFYED